LRLLFIDDNGHAAHYYADFVLNQNIHADAALYANREAHTHLLLGTRYALLRREFWQYRDWQRDIPDTARNILVTLGGADPENVTEHVLAALRDLPLENMEAVAVIGAAVGEETFDHLQHVLLPHYHKLRLERSVTDMPALMGWADVAISAGGSTVWEMCLMGLPMITIVLADNQRLSADALSRYGASVNLGWYTDARKDTIITTLERLCADHDQRAAMSAAGRRLVDGRGAERGNE
jgi:spore coat polysaccharide biosynthesis predicted glycosyltransferase SpsG